MSDGSDWILDLNDKQCRRAPLPVFFREYIYYGWRDNRLRPPRLSWMLIERFVLANQQTGMIRRFSRAFPTAMLNPS